MQHSRIGAKSRSALRVLCALMLALSAVGTASCQFWGRTPSAPVERQSSAGPAQDATKSASAPSQPATAAAPSTETPKRTYVVCIDPGHQVRTDGRTEPLGPGSAQMMLSDGGGATGVVTGVPEYKVNLAISMVIKAKLENAGIMVVMTRTTNDVVLTNAQRAAIANDAHADLFLRIHADSSTDGSIAGVSTLYPADNQWTHAFSAASMSAAKLIQKSVTAETGARDRGIAGRGDLIGFNWAQVPSVLVETGFQSNAAEDRLLVSPEYQDKIAEGIADGVVAYLQSAGS